MWILVLKSSNHSPVYQGLTYLSDVIIWLLMFLRFTWRTEASRNIWASTLLLKMALSWMSSYPATNSGQPLLWLSCTLGCFLTTGDLGSYPHCRIKLAQSHLTRQASWFQMVSVNLFKLIGNNWNRKKNCYCGFLWAWCFVAMHFLASEWLVFLFLLITLWFYWTCVTNFPVINSENARVFVPNGWVGETEQHLKSTPIISNGFSLKAQHWDGHISKHF